MADALPGAIVPLEIPFAFAPGGPGLELLAFEEHPDVYLIIAGWAPSIATSDRRTCTGILTFRGVTQLRYGYPNEEAFFADPRGVLDHGVSEIVGSGWAASLDAYNRSSYGVGLPGGAELRHLFVGAKDASAQFLCEGFDVEIVDEAFVSAARAQARSMVMNRVLGGHR